MFQRNFTLLCVFFNAVLPEIQQFLGLVHFCKRSIEISLYVSLFCFEPFEPDSSKHWLVFTPNFSGAHTGISIF